MRPADVRGDQVEQARGGGREQLDPKAGVQEDGGDVGAVEQIGHVVRGRLHLLDLLVKLVVDGAQLLVERLQLLLGGLQLLVGGLEFLVHRHDFFVRRLEFLVGTFQLLDGALQVIARGLQLLLELAQQIRLCRLGAGSCFGQRFTRRIRLLLERDQQQTFGLFGQVERLRPRCSPGGCRPRGASSRL